MGKVLDLLSKGASAPAGDVTHVNEAKTAEEALTVLSKEARKALRETGLWNQEFHGQEFIKKNSAKMKVYEMAKALNTSRNTVHRVKMQMEITL